MLFIFLRPQMNKFTGSGINLRRHRMN